MMMTATTITIETKGTAVAAKARLQRGGSGQLGGGGVSVGGSFFPWWKSPSRTPIGSPSRTSEVVLTSFQLILASSNAKLWYNGGGSPKHYPHDVTQNKTSYKIRWRITINRERKSDFYVYKKKYNSTVTYNKNLAYIRWRATKYKTNKWRTPICMTTKVKKIKLQHRYGVVQQILP